MKFSEIIDEQTNSFSCVMASVSGSVRDEIEAFGRSINEEDLEIDEEQGYTGIEPYVHITVKYGLHTTDVNDVIEIIDDVVYEPIKAKLGKMSMFENDTDVLKIEVDSLQLHELNEVIAKRLKTTDTYPKYIPHVTIGYLKSGTARKYIEASKEIFDGKEIIIEALVFSSKDGTETEIKIPQEVM